MVIGAGLRVLITEDRLRCLGIDPLPDMPRRLAAPERVELDSRRPQPVAGGPEMPTLPVAGVHRMPGSVDGRWSIERRASTTFVGPSRRKISDCASLMKRVLFRRLG